MLQNQLMCKHELETSFTTEHEPDCELSVHPDHHGDCTTDGLNTCVFVPMLIKDKYDSRFAIVT